MPRRKATRELTPDERRAKRKRDFWTLDLPLIFGLTLCTVFTIIEGVRGFDGNGRALAYAFQWPTIGAIIIWIWYRYKREGLPAEDDSSDSARPGDNAETATAPPRKRRSLGFANHYKERIEEAGEEYAAALHAADKTSKAPVIPASDDGLRDWRAYVADLERRDPPGQPPTSGA